MSYTQHEGIISYTDIFGIGDAIAPRLAKMTGLIQTKLPSGFIYSGDFYVDKANNQIHIYVAENNSPAQMIPILALVAIVAVIAALIGIIVASIKWKEADQLKADINLKNEDITKLSQGWQGLIDQLNAIWNNPSLTDAQKVAAANSLMAASQGQLTTALTNAATNNGSTGNPTNWTNIALIGAAAVIGYALVNKK